jgi:hypothetical protein
MAVDLSSLSREQLLELLAQKEKSEDISPTIVGGANNESPKPKSKKKNVDVSEKKITSDSESLINSKCHFRPLRANQKECENLATTEWGFCKKHSGTVQSRKAKEQWEELHKVKTEEFEEKSVEESPITGELRTLVDQLKDTVNKNPPKPRRILKLIRNERGRYEDPETHVLFNPETKKAYGVQRKNGDVRGFTPQEKEMCKRKGWEYLDLESSDESSSESESGESYSDSSESGSETGSEESYSDSDTYESYSDSGDSYDSY